MLGLIEQSARGLETMLTGALELAGVAGVAREAPRRDRIDLPALLERVRLAFAPEAARKGLQLRTAVEGPPSMVCRGDEPRMRQILSELVANALKFTDAGDVDLKVTLQPDPAGVRARFDVSDTGEGFDPAHKDRLFERFQQADSASTRRRGGSGVGLAVSRALAEALGGTLDAASAPGRGSTFTFQLLLETGEACSAA